MYTKSLKHHEKHLVYKYVLSRDLNRDNYGANLRCNGSEFHIMGALAAKDQFGFYALQEGLVCGPKDTFSGPVRDCCYYSIYMLYVGCDVL